MARTRKNADKTPVNIAECDPEHQALLLQVRAEQANRDPERVPEFRAYLRDHPEVRANIKSLAYFAKQQLLDKFGKGEGSRVLNEAALQNLQQRLISDRPSAVEELLVEAVLLCWIRVQYAELYRTAAMKEGQTFKAIEHAEKVLTQSYSRYTRALMHLAKVQRLSLAKTKIHVRHESAGELPEWQN